MTNIDDLDVGFDVPAAIGMAETDIQTPALILDLDALERNIRKMGDYAKANGMRHRVHGKMHRSVDVARLQHRLGGAVGVCCQKVAEAEVFVRAGLGDVLVSNQVRDPAKIARLARLPKLGAEVTVCVDDVANVAELSEAASVNETEIGVLVEIDVGAGRCGVGSPDQAVAIAIAVSAAPALRFEGVQAYQGAMQHHATHEARAVSFRKVMELTTSVVDALNAAGLTPTIVSGGGTGSYRFEATSGVFNELQCGSYAFMDADYGRLTTQDGVRMDEGEWENALFVLTSVMSCAKPEKAVVDAGHKAHAIDSGLPTVFGRADLTVLDASDEHSVIDDPNNTLRINEKLRLVPGHCDPTCNLHDWYVGVRGGLVETLWPVSARGKGF